ncbi:recombinase RecT [Ruania suaedae]|uniref:recombinase RecT n=1 Tax=Ruania suaedae TaxID=2897774 RepID=UPI001E55C43E|nr:recombinase RecT [Ruania suaedae]UFU03461.1 recombinase RecT [Ruania suaedae]
MTTDVATQQPAQPKLVVALQSMKPELERALPRHMSGDRIARIVLTEIRKNPKLAQSTPDSFFGSLLTAAALGLEPGVNGEAYLVPYEHRRGRLAGQVECQLIVGYQGVAKLFWQHPLAKRLSAEYVCEHDHFAYDKGLTLKLEHTPAQGDRGKVIGYYAIVELNSGGMAFDFFTPDQIQRLRNGKVGTSGDIADPERWMERKTALKQVLKLLPKSVELATAIRTDETVGSMAVGKAIASGSSLPELEYPDAEQSADVAPPPEEPAP